MFDHRFLYPVVSRVLALVLIVAGAFKGADWLKSGADAHKQWWLALAAGFEFLLGIWLMLGVYPRWARLVTLACFVVLLNVALWGVASQRESCGCLGNKVSVRPWAATTLDSCAIVGLLLCAPVGVPGLTVPLRRWHGAVLGMSVVIIAIVIACPYLPKRSAGSQDSGAPQVEPTGVDSAGLVPVIDALQRNRAALNAIAFATEETSTQHAIEAWNRVLHGTDEQKKAFFSAGDRTMRSKCEYVYRGNEIRVECRCLQSPNRADGKADESNYDLLMVGSRGRMVKYITGLQHAWLFTMPTTIDDGIKPTLDLRCAGFRGPISSIPDWLRENELTAGGLVNANGKTVFRVRALEKVPPACYVTATFDPNFNYLPTRVVYWFHPNGGVDTVTDINYSRLHNGAWFPESLRIRHFIRDTGNDPDAPNGQSGTRETKVFNVSADAQVSDDTFDPLIPPHTRLTGDLAPGGRTGDRALRASEIFRGTARQATPPSERAVFSSAGNRRFWLAAAGTDAALFALAFFFRKRFAL
jgi:hypothetical protein